MARLNRIHARLAARRQDFTHKLTRTLIDCHAGVAVEKLRLKGLMRTRLAKSFADAGIGELLRQLRYKAEWAARDYREMPTFDRSTGVCPECGWVGPKLPLAIREWRCDGCGAMHDRDVAAAQVILRDAVPPVRREPAGTSWRKRGTAIRHGLSTSVEGSESRPPSNVVLARVARGSCEPRQ